MAILPQNVDYTTRDFEALSDRLRGLIRSVFPDWTDENISNFGNILLECFCHVGDVLGFYLENQSRESRITTAKQRSSLVGLVKLLNFTPASARAATVDVDFSLPSPMASTVTIPKGTFVGTLNVQNQVRFQLLSDAVIQAGSTNVTATVEHSVTYEDSFLSSGDSDQEVVLERSPYLDSTAIVSADNGDYSIVKDFLVSTDQDRHCVIQVDSDDRAHVFFGNGINGQIPSGTIVVSYRTGGGTEGRVEANTIRRIDGVFTDANGTVAHVRVNNRSKSSGGTARMTNAQIKALAPASFRAPRSTVAQEDYEIHALTVPGVARALMLTADQDEGIEENTGILYVIPRGGGVPSQALKDAVLESVTKTYPKTLTFQIDVNDPVYKVIDVWATVWPTKAITTPSALAALGANIRANLAAFMAIELEDGSPNPTVNFGAGLGLVRVIPPGLSASSPKATYGELPLSDLFNVVRDTAGVRKVDSGQTGFLLNGARTDVLLAMREFPVLGQVTLVNGDTGHAF